MTGFTKLHSLGNDFIVVDPESTPEPSRLAEFARRICDRHTGVGADGCLIIAVRDDVQGRADFRIFNADGSEAEISGNGLRCAATYLFHTRRVPATRVLFHTSAGDRICERLENQGPLFQIRNEMGVPRLHSRDIPFDDGREHERIIDYPLSINRKIYPITCVSVGNPHCDVFVDRFPTRIEWNHLGREIESHPFFPNRVNVEFIRVLNRSEIEVVFWERGVGETLSSGTGSSAAAISSILKGLTDRRVKVWTSMGDVVVEWEKDVVYQSGPAEVVFSGTYAQPL
ncbi:MAG: diaminopimelate epimerase [Candidatus Aminicenantes bacterium]|nr:diaminopimelate epimerase [Candidatus Aminicenantes bacterium]